MVQLIIDGITSMCEFVNYDILSLPNPTDTKLELPSDVIGIKKLQLKYYKYLKYVFIPSSCVFIKDDFMFDDCKTLIKVKSYNNTKIIKTSFKLNDCYELDEFPFYVNIIQRCPCLNKYSFYDSVLDFKISYDNTNNTQINNHDDLYDYINLEYVNNNEFCTDIKTNDNDCLFMENTNYNTLKHEITLDHKDSNSLNNDLYNKYILN